MKALNHIAIYCPANIGDIIVTLPMTGILKEQHQNCVITYIAKEYTHPILQLSKNVNNFIDINNLRQNSEQNIVNHLSNANIDAIILITNDSWMAKISKQSAIPYRVGSIRKIYNWIYCNRLVLDSHHRNSPIHTSDRNIQLLKPLLRKINYRTNKVILSGVKQINTTITDSCNKIRLILHPGSRGHGAEWPIPNYIALISQLPEHKYEIFITGTSEERSKFSQIISISSQEEHVHDMMGKLSLKEFIELITTSDMLIASSTGPAHLSAILGIVTLTLFPPYSKKLKWQLTPNKWKPIGTNSYVVQDENNMSKLADNTYRGMHEITPNQAKNIIKKLSAKQTK